MRRGTQTAPIVTIEATAKKWKAVQLAGAGVTILGLICLALFISAGSTRPLRVTALIPLFGVCIMVYGSVMAWWHHG